MQNISESKLTLLTGWKGEFQHPSDNEIVEVIQDMPGGENSFVVLQNNADSFVQVAGHEELGFLLEYWENK
jgi:hypothetical protein